MQGVLCLNKIGIYPEVKEPWFHRSEGKDISVEVLKVHKECGYTKKEDLVYFQCFDPNVVICVKNELLLEYGMNIKLVQLIAETSWNETDKEKILDYTENFEDMLDVFYNEAGVDGVFTDFPDRVVKFLDNK